MKSLNEAKYLCSDCRGTGASKVNKDGSWYHCWTCNGNGLDPSAYFNWSNKCKADNFSLDNEAAFKVI